MRDPVDTKRFLLALDGDDVVLKTIARLASAYYEVRATRDPVRWLGWLQGSENVAVVVTEHVLRNSNGVTLLETARTTCPTARRVLMTTYHDLAGIVAGLHSGVIERLVQKPFTRGELMTAILPENVPADASQRASA
jgi:DNA-binding NtrC family response regulator